MQVISIDKRFTRLSGRLGDFVFRTFKSGKMFATYDPIGTRVNPDAIPIRFREQMKELNLEIVEHPKTSKHS